MSYLASLLLSFITVCSVMNEAVIADLIIQSPTSVIRSISINATTRFICVANSSATVVWVVSTRGFQTLSFDVHFEILNSFGIDQRSFLNGTSILSVARHKENNGTTVQCTVSSDGNIQQSESANLILYGPPDTVLNFTVTDISPLSIKLSWSPVYSIVSFNYSINITTGYENIVTLQLNDTTLSYVFHTDQKNICQLFNFTIVTSNDAGRSEISNITNKALSDGPADITEVTYSVFFEQGFPYINLTFKAPDVCQFYPITSYQLKFNYETPNVQTNTSITITDSVVSNDNYVTLTSPQLESDRNYAASLTAANEVDSTNAQYIEFVTSSVQAAKAILIGNELNITCVFAIGSTDTGCVVVIYNNSNDKELANGTIERDITENTVNGSILLKFVTDLYVVVYDDDDDTDTSVIGLTITPTVISPTTTSSTAASTTLLPIASTMLLPTASTVPPVTTNIQTVSVSVNTNCTLTVSCHFTSNSNANGCHVVFRDNISSSYITEILIARIGQSLVSIATIKETQYELFKMDLIYIVEGFGTINGTRVDELNVTAKFHITNRSNICQITVVSNCNCGPFVHIYWTVLFIVLIIYLII